MAAGGPTSHAAILAAAMGIPALVALGARLLSLAEGTTLVLDADRGTLEVAPAPARLGEVRAALGARAARRAALTAAAQQPARTADGTRIEVFANVGSVAEAEAALVNGAEGCGLLRTEFLFLDREQAPSEEEQRVAYQRIADALGGRPLVIRTLDVGGDKPIAYLPLPPEDNPALGLRGMRTGLAHPQLLRTQLAALLAVRCRVLLPMITDVAEVRRVRALLAELAAARGLAMPELGVDDRDARGGAARRSAGRGRGLPLDRHQRPHAVHARHGPRPSAAGAAARRAAPGGAAAHRARRPRRPARTAAASRCAAAWPPTSQAAPILIGLGVERALGRRRP